MQTSRLNTKPGTLSRNRKQLFLIRLTSGRGGGEGKERGGDHEENARKKVKEAKRRQEGEEYGEKLKEDVEKVNVEEEERRKSWEEGGEEEQKEKEQEKERW